MTERDPNFVDANQRYASAHQETVARIQARDLAVAGFVTLTGTLITISTKDGYELVAVAVGFVALAAALLSCHHDIIVGHLGLFQHRLCQSQESETNWFSKHNFDRVLQARRLRDWSFASLVFVGGGVGLSISYSAATAGHRIVKTAIWYLSAACLIAALAYIYYAHQTRTELREEMRRVES